MKEASANILLVALDDDADELEILQSILDEYKVSNYQLHTDKEAFLKDLKSDINLCIIDHRLGLENGLVITKEVKKINQDNYVMITSGMRDFDVAVEYLNAGADKFLKKSDEDYKQKLIEYLREGFQVAKKRIRDAEDRRLFFELRQRSSQEISELIQKINEV